MGENVLVTGGAGFVGSHLASNLLLSRYLRRGAAELDPGRWIGGGYRGGSAGGVGDAMRAGVAGVLGALSAVIK